MSVVNSFRIGQGYDVHRFQEGRPLILGGVTIPHHSGLAGHSDADVLLHAIIDAMLGAAALGDIGSHFPDTDESFRDIDSKILLRRVNELVCGERGYRISNIDSTIVAERPKLRPYIDSIRDSVASILQVSIDKVSVKATTNEKMGPFGRGEGMLAMATVGLFT